MTGTSGGRPPARLSLALACLAMLALHPASAELEYHNYLEKVPVKRMQVAYEAGVELSYNASQLERSGQWVTVTLRGVKRVHAHDAIALFTPPDAYLDGAAPVKYSMASQDNGYLEKGSATLQFRVLNLRQDMRFVLIRHTFTDPVVAAAGPVLENTDPNELTGIHLMPGHRPVDMLVQWTTRDMGQPYARFGLRPDNLMFASPATTERYGRRDMCGAPASAEGWLDPGHLHTSVMAGLTPNTRYYYVVADAAQNDPATGLAPRMSDVRSFLSHPGVGPGVTVSVLGVADQGVGEPDGSAAAMEYQPALEVAQRMLQDAQNGYKGFGNDSEEVHPYRLALHNGDISYARGYGALWDTFLYQQRDIMQRVPVATSIANHERDWPGQAFYTSSDDSGGECGVPYYARFPMPRPNLAADQAFYSFDFGPAHIAVMSTEHDYTPGSPQHLWLAGDLAAVDRSVTPWLLLMGHRPLYIDAADFFWPTGKQTTALQLSVALEYLLREHKVDVVLAGHHHSYQRTCAVNLNKCMGRHSEEHRSNHGTVHICFGHGGADLTDNGFDRAPTWIEYENFHIHGHIRLHMNGTHFHMQAVESKEGKVFDEVWLTKRGHKKRAEERSWYDAIPATALATE